MTEAQRRALVWFRRRSVDACRFEGRWTFPWHVREDAALAARLCAALSL